MKQDYVLITAARNEAKCIHLPICSIINQSLLPKKWVIVSDGSTDGTDSILNGYAQKYDFIHYLRRDGNKEERGFASKVYALREAYAHLNNLGYEFIGNLDGDVSIESDYMENIIARFSNDERLGIAGGFIYEYGRGQFKSRGTNSIRSVAGAIQMFRRKCFEEIRGFSPARFGGEDWIAEIMARMRGWKVEAFPEYPVFHHKASAEVRGWWKDAIREGAVGYSVGSHPVFEIAKSIRRVQKKPWFIGAAFRMGSYLWHSCRREDRVVTDEILAFLRREQMTRLKEFLGVKR